MILIPLSQFSTMLPLHSSFTKAATILNHAIVEGIPNGTYHFENSSIAIVSAGTGDPRGKAPLESHKKYIDLQYIIEGVDHMGWKPLHRCNSCIKPYSEEDDKALYEDFPDTFFDVHADQMAIFFPEDAHAPMNGDSFVRKIILKILV